MARAEIRCMATSQVCCECYTRAHRVRRDVCTSSIAVQQARNAFKKGSTPQEVADRLTQLAVKRYTADNVAVVVVLLGLSGQHSDSAGKASGKASGDGKSKGLFGMF